MDTLSQHFAQLPQELLEKVVVNYTVKFTSYSELLSPLKLSYADVFSSIKPYAFRNKDSISITVSDLHEFLTAQHIAHRFADDPTYIKEQVKSLIPQKYYDSVKLTNGIIRLKNNLVLQGITKTNYQTIKKYIDEMHNQNANAHVRELAFSYTDFLRMVTRISEANDHSHATSSNKQAICKDTLFNYLADDAKELLPKDVQNLPVITEDGEKLVFIKSFNNLAKLVHKSSETPINHFKYLNDPKKNSYWSGGRNPIKMPIEAAISYLKNIAKAKAGNHSFSLLKDVKFDSAKSLGELVNELFRKDPSMDISWIIDAKYAVSIINQDDESFIFFKSFNNVATSLSVDPKVAKEKFLKLFPKTELYTTTEGLKLPVLEGLKYIHELVTRSAKTGSLKTDITCYLNGLPLSSFIDQTEDIIPEIFLNRPIYRDDEGKYFVVAKCTSEISDAYNVDKNLVLGLLDFKQYRKNGNVIMLPFDKALHIFEKIYNKKNHASASIQKRVDGPILAVGVKSGLEELIAIKKEHPAATLIYDRENNTLHMAKLNKIGQLEEIYFTYKSIS